MPYIHIRVNRSTSKAERSQLQSRTTELMSLIMGKRAEVTVVQVESSESSGWSVAGGPLSPDVPAAAYVNIKITEATNTETEKAEMIRRTVDMLCDTLTCVQEATYVVIDEIPATSWGYNGQTQAARAASAS